MFSKSNLISTIVTGLWAFFGGWILWGMIADPFFKDHVLSAGLMKEMPDFPLLILGCLITGFAFSTIYSKWARGHHSASEGSQFGLWIGILVGFGNGIVDHSTANLLDLTATLVNGVIYIVFFVVMGVLASSVYGKTSSKE